MNAPHSNSRLDGNSHRVASSPALFPESAPDQPGPTSEAWAPENSAEALDRTSPLAQSDSDFPQLRQEAFGQPVFRGLGTHADRESIYPRNTEELLERIMFIRDLYITGELHEEVRHLGVAESWLDGLHAESPVVAFAEHPAYLPAFFYKLGKWGSPMAMAEAMQSLNSLARVLPEVTGRSDIKVGIYTSPDHSVTFNGITNYTYIQRPGPNGGEAVRHHLFTKGERSELQGCSFTDLTVDPNILEKVESMFQSLRAEFSRNAKRGAPGADWDLQHAACGDFIADWRQAVSEAVSSGEPGRVEYVDLISRLNPLISRRYGGPDNFEVHFTDYLNTLVTHGVKDWARFVYGISSSKILNIREEPLLRLRVDGDNGSNFTSLYVDRVGSHGTFVRDTKEVGGNVYDVAKLQEASKQSMSEGHGPSLIPIGELRYIVNFGWSQSALLDDGMPYEPITRVARAFREGHITDRPRGLTVLPYTDLHTHRPQNPAKPYADLTEQFHILDYYTFARAHELNLRGEFLY